MNDFIGREVPDNPQPIVMMVVLFHKPTVFYLLLSKIYTE